jgi:DNA-binding NarL/FixJ family response regulator
MGLRKATHGATAENPLTPVAARGEDGSVAVSSRASTERAVIRVVIAEDAFLAREAIEQVLARSEDVEVVEICEDQYSLLAAVEDKRPDVVVTDIRMPPTDTNEGIQAAQAIRESHPEIGVVVLSQFVEPAYALALLESGSAGRAYLLKERIHDEHQLIRAIKSVSDGESVIDPKVVDALVEARARYNASPLKDLTERETEILAEIAQGKSNAAIGESLFLTKRAVEKHINSIFMKLGLRDADDVSRRVKAALMFLADNERTLGT